MCVEVFSVLGEVCSEHILVCNWQCEFVVCSMMCAEFTLMYKECSASSLLCNLWCEVCSVSV